MSPMPPAKRQRGRVRFSATHARARSIAVVEVAAVVARRKGEEEADDDEQPDRRPGAARPAPR